MKEKNKKKNWLEASVSTTGKGLLVMMLICVVSLMVVFATMDEVVKDSSVETEEMWQMVYVWTPLGEGDPGTGASGFLEVFFINHTAENLNTTYDENSSSTLEGWCTANMVGKTPYATADDFNVELASEVSFDIVVRVRFNKTHAWETDHFNGDDCDCQITTSCTGWADGNDEANESARVHAAAVESRNNTGEDFIWINFVWNADDDGGYQLADDATLTVSEIYIEAKF